MTTNKKFYRKLLEDCPTGVLGYCMAAEGITRYVEDILENEDAIRFAGVPFFDTEEWLETAEYLKNTLEERLEDNG